MRRGWWLTAVSIAPWWTGNPWSLPKENVPMIRYRRFGWHYPTIDPLIISLEHREKSSVYRAIPYPQGLHLNFPTRNSRSLHLVPERGPYAFTSGIYDFHLIFSFPTICWDMEVRIQNNMWRIALFGENWSEGRGTLYSYPGNKPRSFVTYPCASVRFKITSCLLKKVSGYSDYRNLTEASSTPRISPTTLVHTAHCCRFDIGLSSWPDSTFAISWAWRPFPLLLHKSTPQCPKKRVSLHKFFLGSLSNSELGIGP
jgi:hypothetical protein